MKERTKYTSCFNLILAAGLCLAMGATFITPDSSAAAPEVQNMVGVFDGFLQVAADPPDPVRTEVASQENRRFTGLASPPDPVQPITFEGTVSASGKVNIQGQSLDGSHSVGKAELLDFGGGAAILNGTLTRPSVDNRFIIPCILVMRAFAGDGSVVPNPEGRYVGGISTEGATGQIDMVLSNPPDPVRPTSFDGSIEIVLGGETHTLQLLGTINSSGRIIGIAHRSGPGHMILDAVLDPPTDTTPATVRGTFKLELDQGVEHEGSFDAPLFRSTAS